MDNEQTDITKIPISNEKKKAVLDEAKNLLQNAFFRRLLIIKDIKELNEEEIKQITFFKVGINLIIDKKPFVDSKDKDNSIYVTQGVGLAYSRSISQKIHKEIIEYIGKILTKHELKFDVLDNSTIKNAITYATNNGIEPNTLLLNYKISLPTNLTHPFKKDQLTHLESRDYFIGDTGNVSVFFSPFMPTNFVYLYDNQKLANIVIKHEHYDLKEIPLEEYDSIHKELKIEKEELTNKINLQINMVIGVYNIDNNAGIRISIKNSSVVEK